MTRLVNILLSYDIDFAITSSPTWYSTSNWRLLMLNAFIINVKLIVFQIMRWIMTLEMMIIGMQSWIFRWWYWATYWFNWNNIIL